MQVLGRLFLIIMHSLSNLLLQLRSLARSPISHNGFQQAIPATSNDQCRRYSSKNEVGNSKRFRPTEDDCEDCFHDCVSNLEENETTGTAISRMVGCCPRCVFDVHSKTSSATKTDSTSLKTNFNKTVPAYCQLYRYRRLSNTNRLRKQVRLPTTASSRRSNGVAANDYVKKSNLEFLGTFLANLGQQKTDCRQSMSSTDVENALMIWTKMVEKLQSSASGKPRLGLFIDTIPEETLNSAPGLKGCAETLIKLAHHLSSVSQVGSSKVQTDKETEIANRNVICVDNSVQCDCPVLRSTLETIRSTRVSGKFRYTSNKAQEPGEEFRPSWTPMRLEMGTRNFTPELTDIPESHNPLANRETFNPGDDLLLKLSQVVLTSGKISIEATVTESTDRTSSTAKSTKNKCVDKDYLSIYESATEVNTSISSENCLYTVAEMPSTIEVRQRCKDVLSLPAQSELGQVSKSRLRSHRSYTQTNYVTKTVLSLLRDSRSSANLTSLMNSASFHSAQSKRSLGKFLLDEKLKRMLTNITTNDLTTMNQSTSISRTELFPLSSTTSMSESKSSEFKTPKPWDEQLQTISQEPTPNNLLELSDENMTINNDTKKSRESSTVDDNSSHQAPSTDVSEEDLNSLRELLLRSCSFTSPSAITMILDQKNFFNNKVDVQSKNSEVNQSEARKFFPKESCSFAECASIVKEIHRPQTQTTMSTSSLKSTLDDGSILTSDDRHHAEDENTDQVVINNEHQVVFEDKFVQVDLESVYYPSSTKVELPTRENSSIKDEEEMNGLINWRPNLAPNMFFKNFNFLSAV